MVVGQSKRVHCLALVKREKSKLVAKKFMTFSEAWLCLIFDAFSDSGSDAAAFHSASQPSTIRSINVLTATQPLDSENLCEIKNN